LIFCSSWCGVRVFEKLSSSNGKASFFFTNPFLLRRKKHMSVIDTKDISKAFTNAPQWVTVVLIVFLFCWHLDRTGERELKRLDHAAKLSDIRISACHGVQQRATDTMMKLSETLGEQTIAMRVLVSSLHGFPGDVEIRPNN
jgi:hypothetical protein